MTPTKKKAEPGIVRQFKCERCGEPTTEGVIICHECALILGKTGDVE